jgi:toxin secretion/phage lysis holin
MKEILNYIICGILTVATFLFGEFDGIMTALIIVIFIDLITGITVAFVEKKVSSEVCTKGFARKFLMLLIVALGHVLDMYIIGSGNALKVAAALYYIICESVSIIENCAALGLPVPKKLKDVLEQLKNESGDDDMGENNGKESGQNGTNAG